MSENGSRLDLRKRLEELLSNENQSVTNHFKIKYKCCIFGVI